MVWANYLGLRYPMPLIRPVSTIVSLAASVIGQQALHIQIPAGVETAAGLPEEESVVSGPLRGFLFWSRRFLLY